MNTELKKNYAPTRYSSAFGKDGNKINLAFDKSQILEWFGAMEADAKGIVRICITPRLNPSESNKFSVFQDTWKPGQPSAPKSVPMSPEAVQSGLRQVRDAVKAEQQEVPF